MARLSQFPWSPPWVADQPDDQPNNRPDAWQIAGRRDYRHASADPGSIHFNFDRASEGGKGWYAYNEFTGSDRLTEPLEDVRIAASFQPDGPGLTASLATTTRLDQPDVDAQPLTLSGRIDAQGQAFLEATVEVDRRASGIKEVGPFQAGVARRMELWYVDQEASLWVDGRRVCLYRFDLPMDVLVNRPPPQRYPRISVHVAGSPVTLHQVDIDRDLYYSSELESGTLAEGGLAKHGRERLGKPIHVEKNEFFCMGDNSPRSEDGRFWYTGGPNIPPVNPWIKARLESTGHQQVTGVVPRQLMTGRALFVYFPAPYAWHNVGPAVIPDFGNMHESSFTDPDFTGFSGG